MKLQSLKEVNPTEKDIGRTVYDAHGDIYYLATDSMSKNIEPINRRTARLDYSCDLGFENLYWQPVILVSQEEYDYLKDIEKKYLEDLEQHTNQFGDVEPNSEPTADKVSE